MLADRVQQWALEEAAVLVVRSPKSDMSLAPPEKARLPSSLKALAAWEWEGIARVVRTRRPRARESDGVNGVQ